MRSIVMSRRLSAALLVGLLCLVAGPVGAIGLQISPISLTIEASQTAQGLWLNNTGETELHAQVRVFGWTQAGFEGMQLAPSRGLIVSPPMVTLQPGQRQLVRVIRTGPPPQGASEQAYRLIINELPQPQSAQKEGINFILRYSVPVFVAPVSDSPSAAPQLRWQLRVDGNQAVLVATNTGNKHAHVSQVAFVTAAGKRITLAKGLFGYVLPHVTRKWKLQSSANLFADGGRIHAVINDQATTQPVAVTRAEP